MADKNTAQPSVESEPTAATLVRYTALFERGCRLSDAHIFVDGRRHKRPGWLARRALRKAIRDLEECVRLVPQSWPAMWIAGKCYQALGDDANALRWFEATAARESGNPDVYRETSAAALALGDGARGVAFAEKALGLAPDNAGLVANLALALCIAGRDADAVAAAKRAVALDGADPINQTVLTIVAGVVARSRPRPTRL